MGERRWLATACLAGSLNRRDMPFGSRRPARRLGMCGTWGKLNNTRDQPFRAGSPGRASPRAIFWTKWIEHAPHSRSNTKPRIEARRDHCAITDLGSENKKGAGFTRALEFLLWRLFRLVAIMLGFVRAFLGHAEVIGLRFREFRQFHADFFEV